MESTLMKVPDVVARLGVSRAKVYELMASGEIHSVRVGGARRVRSEDLDRFISGLDATWPAARTHGPSPALTRAPLKS